MENNENLSGKEPQPTSTTPANDTQSTTTTTNDTFDYKAAYEKLQKDYVNNEKYAKDLKARLQNKMSDEEKLKAQQDELNAHYQELERENKTMKFKAELSKSISDAQIVENITQLFVDNDVNGGLQKINEYIVNQRNTYEAKLKEVGLTNNQTPPPSNGTNTKKWSDYTMAELNELQATNPQEYNRILNSIK